MNSIHKINFSRRMLNKTCTEVVLGSVLTNTKNRNVATIATNYLSENGSQLPKCLAYQIQDNGYNVQHHIGIQ
jgi:hypothetical protein